MRTEPRVVEYFLQPDSEPASCLAMQLYLMNAVADGRRPAALFAYSFRDDHAALGRFHLAPDDRGTDLHRRIAGGRVLPIGPGYAGVALVLPRRDAMTDDAPGTLSAPQVMNRHVRGLLKGCRALGLDPIYPGRDVVTVDKKIIASVGLETDRRGAAVFEMVVAVWRAFDEVPSLIDRADPDGVVTAAILVPDEVTDLERELDQKLAFEDFARLLRHGFEEQLAATMVAGRLDASEEQEVRQLADDPAVLSKWVYGRSRSERLTHRGSLLGSAGQMDVYFEESGGVLGEVVVSGDVIANSDGIERLESALRGCRREAAAIDQAIAGACSRPQDFLLGVGPPGSVRDAILRGEPW
jgi:lipoate-protein ligase A